MCHPAARSVVLMNNNPAQSIAMSSISSESDEFQSSFFEHEVISELLIDVNFFQRLHPGENTTVSVYFLGKKLGKAASTITFATSQGDVMYDVRGSTVPHPGRLSPLTSGRVPTRMEFRHAISLRNMNAVALQVCMTMTACSYDRCWKCTAAPGSCRSTSLALPPTPRRCVCGRFAKGVVLQQSLGPSAI